MCNSNRSWFWGPLKKINVFVFFWAKHKPYLKFFHRNMVYIVLIHLLNQVTWFMIPICKYRSKLTYAHCPVTWLREKFAYLWYEILSSHNDVSKMWYMSYYLQIRKRCISILPHFGENCEEIYPSHLSFTSPQSNRQHSSLSSVQNIVYTISSDSFILAAWCMT